MKYRKRVRCLQGDIFMQIEVHSFVVTNTDIKSCYFTWFFTEMNIHWEIVQNVVHYM